MRYERLAGAEVPNDAVVVSVRKNNGRVLADLACMHCAAQEMIVADFPRPLSIALERASEVAEECGLAKVVIAVTNDDLWRLVQDRLSRRDSADWPAARPVHQHSH